MEKANEVTVTALHGAQEQYAVTVAVALLMYALAPAGSSISHGTLVWRLHLATEGLRAYINYMASTCVTHVLSLVTALYPKQDMKPFVEGRVPGVTDGEYAALEKQVEETMKTIMERLDF